MEYNPDVVKDKIFTKSNFSDISGILNFAKSAGSSVEGLITRIISTLEIELDRRNDILLKEIIDKVRKQKLGNMNDYLKAFSSNKNILTRDSRAAYQGIIIPPHISVLAELSEIQSPYFVAKELLKITNQAIDHLKRIERCKTLDVSHGTKVFIGHGQSNVWRELKDFIKDRLLLPWDEFNRIPVAGITNVDRLSEMLCSAAVALIIMTGEDEQSNGKMYARENVIHEVGLFQGRLGFTKAIVLLEQGCEEFSNIQGLGQIRFERGKISTCFEEVRRVLERENLIK